MTYFDLKSWLVLFLTLQSAPANSFQTVKRIVTEDVVHKANILFDNGKWNAFHNQPNADVISTEPHNYIGPKIYDIKCLRKLNSDHCSKQVGFSLWMRYGGFISDILGDVSQYHETITQWVGEVTPKDFKWIKCYNSKEHGWDMENFHRNCDSRGPTISLFKVRDDAIFGGFTSASWGLPDEHKYADNAFLFSIKSADGTNSSRFKVKSSEKGHAIYSNQDYGPCFGTNDLFIGNNPHIEGSCSSELGQKYEKATVNDDEAKTILAGSSKFGLTQMEVFYMECFHLHEFLDSNMTGSENFNPQDARLSGGGAIPGTYLQIDLGTKQVISGFAVIAKCSFTLVYLNGVSQEETYNETAGTTKTFTPMSNVLTTYVLKTALLTRIVKFQLTSPSCVFSVELYGCQQECNAALGMQSTLIQNSQISSDNNDDNKHLPIYARANTKLGDKGCWKADDGNYLQIDLLVTKIISMIGIQSCYKQTDHFPSTFKIRYAGDDGVFRNFFGSSEIEILHTYHKKKLGQKISKIKLVPPIVARKLRIYPKDKAEMRVELYGCVYLKDFEGPSTILSTGQMIHNSTRGLALSVVKNSNQENILKTTWLSYTKMEFLNDYPLNRAQWALVVFFNFVLDNTKGHFSTNGHQKRSSSRTSENVPNSVNTPIVMVDPVDNADNVQLSDVMVFDSKSTTSSTILLQQTVMRDGPFEIPSSLDPQGTNSFPLKIISPGWIAHQGCTPTANTGPCSGQASGTRFIYMEGSAPAVKGDTAVLSTYYRVSAYHCFEFWYFMWGQNVGRLNVYLEDSIRKRELVWRLAGSQGNLWRNAKIPINRTRAFKVLIEGVVGDGFMADIAIDKLKFHTNHCDFEPSNASLTKITGFSKSDIIGLKSNHSKYLTQALAGAGIPARFWQPCYQTSQGHNIPHFWSTCGSKGPTVTIVQYKEYIFAAFSDRDWNYSDVSSPLNLSSSRSFILSLSNPSSSKKLFKVNKLFRHEAIQIDPTKGPCFGKAFQLHSGSKISSELGTEYGNAADSSFLTGHSSFVANAVEVLYAGDHPCDAWCSLKGWTCDYVTGKCDCGNDRNYGWCRKGLSQAFLGAFNESLHPDLYWNLDTYPTLHETKTGRTVTLDTDEQGKIKQLESGLSRKALQLNAGDLLLGLYQDTCFNLDIIIKKTFSFAMWLKYGEKTEKQFFFTFGSSSEGPVFQLYQTDPSKEILYVKSHFGNKRSVAYFPCPKSVWSHILIVLEGSTSDPTIRVYRNGKVLQTSQKVACGKCNVQDRRADMYISKNGPLYASNASVDEIALWCRALSQDEVKEVHNFFKGPGGFSIHFQLSFPSKTWEDHKDQESDSFKAVQYNLMTKINSIVPSPGAISTTYDCSGPTILNCSVTFDIYNNNGDFIPKFSNNGALGTDVDISLAIYTIVPPEIPKLQGHNTSTTEIALQWDVPESFYSIYQSYNLTWYPVDNPSLINHVVGENYVTSKNLTNLTPYTSYVIRLKLWYLGDVSMNSEPTTVWTAEKAPGPVQDLKATSKGSDCLAVYWKKPLDPIEGRIRFFNVTYYGASTRNSTEVGYQSNAVEYMHNICDLQPTTQYNITVTAFTVEYGPASFASGTTAVKGPTAPPGNVSSHNATAPYDDTSTCFVTWNPPPSETLNGNLTSYRLTFVNLLTNEKAYVEIAACNTSAVLRSLEPYRMYSVVLVVTADTGFSPFSPPVYCFTRGTVPSAPPTNTTAVGSTSTSCRVSWGQVPLLFQNGFIMGYNVSYLKHGDSKTKIKHVVVEGSSTNSTEVTGLEKFTHYNVTLAAFTDKGSGPHANLTCRTQEDVPDDFPSELKVVSKSTENCSISWKAPDIAKANGIILGYRIAINDTNSTDSKQSLPEIILSSCLHAKIVNLKPFRLYNITIQAFNSAGLSNKSELQCMTDEDAPLMAPPNLTCTPITSKQVSAKWSEIPEIQRQGIVRRYVLQFRLLNGTGSIFSLPTNSPARYIRVGPMKEFSLYEVRIAGYTVKMGNYSETPATCMTLEAVPKNPPENVTGNNLTAYSIRVQWDGLSVQPVGILRQWIIYYRIWNASLDTTLNISVPVTQKYIIIDGLELFTLYCIQVAGFTIDVGVKSNCAHIWTDKKVLPPPDGLPAFISQKESSTAKNCSISWAETNNSHPDPDGRVIGYTIYYTPEGSNDTKMVLVTGQNTTSFVLQDLEEYTKYDIQVAAFNIYGAGNKSVSLTCFTKEDVPSQAPVNVKGFNSSSTSIVISWEDIPTRDRNGMIREYRIIIYEVALRNSSVQIITYLPTKRSRRAISVDPHTRAITGLKKFTKYAFQVYGVTIGDGPLSPVIEVTTAEDAPTASPTNLTVVNSSASSLLFTWSNVPEDNRHGIIRYFVIYYWKTEWPIVVLENSTVTIDSVRINPPGRTPEFKFNLTNLEIWTSYTVQVAGFTVRPGVPTKEIALFTDESIPCEPPAFITFDIPKYTQLTVMWTEVNRYCRNGIIRGYRLIYQELLNSPPVTLNFTPSVKTYTLENMNMDANYSIQLLAFTSRGDGNVSYDLAPIDKDGPKKQPMNVLAFNLTTPTAIPVTWSPIPDPIMVERALGYRVSWKVLSIGDVQIEEASWQYFTVRKSSLQATIKGLLNFAHYEVHVSGFSRGGRGPSGISSGQTCRCFKRIATNYRVFPPYNAALISEDLKQVNMSGMIPWILNNLIVDCCQSCQSHGTSYVDFVTNGHQQSAFQKTENDVVKLIDDTNDLSFPIYGWKWQTKYAEIFRFIPLVESPGFAFLLMDPEKDAPLKAVLMSTLGTWPYILIVSLMTLIAGIIMWFLDTAYNEEQFPHSYLRGMACGSWWAFISMTTLGYGDKVPVANHSKAFAVVWVLTGLAIYGILSGSICTAFTSIVYKSKTNIYGSEVAAISNSPEYRFAVRRGAKVSLKINYSNFDEAFEALTSRKVTGMLMDANEAGTKKDQFEKSGSIRIQKVFDFQSTFGVVLAGPSVRLYQCSREWMPANRREMFDHISKYMKVIETNQINELVEISTGLLDPESDVFKEVLRYCLMIYGGCIVLGSFYEIWYQWQKRKMENLQASSPAYQLKVKLQDELRTFTNDFIQDLQTKSINLRKRHRTQLIRLHRKGI